MKRVVPILLLCVLLAACQPPLPADLLSTDTPPISTNTPVTESTATATAPVLDTTTPEIESSSTTPDQPTIAQAGPTKQPANLKARFGEPIAVGRGGIGETISVRRCSRFTIQKACAPLENGKPM